jgi:triacylglycerol lipase
MIYKPLGGTMKKRIIGILVLILVIIIPGIVLAGGSSDTCDTRYPVVLAHGMGASAKIVGIMDYWWGIEGPLEDEGCDVYITSVNGMDSTVNKAIDFKKQVEYILAISRADKVNIIGHSHGTIYSRYAITNLGMASKVASHTSIAGPHRGSELADLIMFSFNDGTVNALGGALDLVYTFLFGDSDPNSVANGYDVTTRNMAAFNKSTPNVSGIYYQSWAAKAKWGCPSVLLEIPWMLMLSQGSGSNDGLVSVNSAKWGTFRGVEDAAWWSPGCDHLNIVGMFFGITPGFDAPDFYIDIVSDLKNRGV